MTKESEKLLEAIKFQVSCTRNECTINKVNELIQQIYYCEDTKNTFSKFNPYKFTDKANGLRPVMECVYYDNGKQVASNGHILAVWNKPYKQEYEGKLIKKNGEEVTGIYPNYKAVFPNTDLPHEVVEIDFDAVKKAIKQAKAFDKNDKYNEYSFYMIEINDMWFNYKTLDDFCGYMQEIGATSINMYGATSAIAVYANGSSGLMMPCFKEEDDAPNVFHVENVKVTKVA